MLLPHPWHLLLVELLLALQVQLCRGESGAGCGDLSLGSIDGGKVGSLVNDEQRLAFLHASSLLHADLLHNPCNQRTDVYVLLALDPGCELAVLGKVLLLHPQRLEMASRRAWRRFATADKHHQQYAPKDMFHFFLSF